MFLKIDKSKKDMERVTSIDIMSERGETLFSIQLLYYEDQQLEHEGYQKGGRAWQHQMNISYFIEMFPGVAEF